MADWFDQQDQNVLKPPATTPGSQTGIQKVGDWFDKQDRQIAGEKETPKEGPSAADYFRHFVGKYIPGAISAGGAVAGGAATEGLGGEVLGAGAGSLLGQNLQSSFPRLFGSAPEGGDSAIQTGEDILGNAVLPSAGKGIVNAIKSRGVSLLSSPFLRGTSPVQRALGQEAEAGGKATLDTMLDKSSLSGVRGLSDEYTKKALTDIPSIQKYKATNGAPAAEAIALNDVVKKGYSPTSNTIEPDKILKAFDGDKSEVYGEAISPQTKQNVVDTMNTIKDAQAQQAKGTPWNGTINYVKHRLIFDSAMMMGGAAAGGISGHEALGLGIGTGIVLSDVALNKLMSNPVTAKAVALAIKTPSTAPQSKLLGQIVANGLRGTYVYYNGPEDKLEKAYVGEDGQLTYDKPRGQ